jgi:hypothetical protein
MPSSFREDMLLLVAYGAAAMGLRSGLVRDAAVSLAVASFDPLRMSVSHSTDVASAALRAPLLFRQVKYSGNGSFYTYGGNCSMGQLLPRGLKMSERNGHNLRQAYGNFIPVSYLADPSKVFLQSDNSDRVIASGNAVFRAIFTDDLSRSYSSDSLPVVDWFVPDKSPMNPGDFCNEELDVRPAFALRDFAQLMHSHVMLFAGAPVCRPQLQRVRALSFNISTAFVCCMIPGIQIQGEAEAIQPHYPKPG